MAGGIKTDGIVGLRPRIIVIGVGGAGSNAVNNMIEAGLDGVTFVAANTDAQALATSNAPVRVQLGATLTEGLGAGSKPEIGEAAAEEALPEIREIITGAHMVFIAAGMGGGTGTGAAAVIARAARELGILTVAVVTKPFQFEGARRMRIAEAGIEELRGAIDTLIVIPNQNLFRIASDKTTFSEAFVLADQVLYSGVACIVDLIVKEGLINLDFADVRTVMSGMGSAMMGTGEATGARRAILAAEEAISNPLLDDVTLRGAKGLLLSISGGDLTLFEVDEAAERVRAEVDPEANIIVGATVEAAMGERVRVSIVASGMTRSEVSAPKPVSSQRVSSSSVSPPMSPAHSAGSTGPVPNALQPPALPEVKSQPVSAAEIRTADQPVPQPAVAPQIHRPDASRPGHGPTFEMDGDFAGSGSLADRLSSAMTTGGAFEGEHAPILGGPPAHWSGSPDPRPTWHAPDGVMIEERWPGPANLSPPGRDLPQQHGARSLGDGLQPPAPPVFEPEPPAEVRRAPRRMPDVADFPPVAQKEYYAKTGHAPAATARLDSLGYEPGTSQGADRGPRPRRSIFERLTGLGRTEGDSPPAVQPPRPALQHQAPTHSSDAGSYGSRDGAPRRDDAPGHRAEKPELPAFFNKSRR